MATGAPLPPPNSLGNKPHRLLLKMHRVYRTKKKRK